MIDVSKLDSDILANLHARGYGDDRIAELSPQNALDEHLTWILGYPGWGRVMLDAWNNISAAELGEEAEGEEG